MGVDGNNGWNLSNYGNANSTVKFSGVEGYLAPQNGSFAGTLELENGPSTFAWQTYSGWGGSHFNIAKVKGSGTIKNVNGGSNYAYNIQDGSEFSGSITTGNYTIFFGSSNVNDTSHKIDIAAGGVATVGSGDTWTATGGIFVNGTITGAGTLASATTFASGATINATNGILSASATVTFAGDMRVIVAAAPSGDEMIEVLNAPSAVIDDRVDAVVFVDGEMAAGSFKLVKEGDKVVLMENVVHGAEEVSASGESTAFGARILNNKTLTITGVGGATMTELSIDKQGELVLNPIKTPILLSQAPSFEAGAKIKLADYETSTCGKFVLLTWTGDAVTLPEGLFDTACVNTTTYTLECVAAPEAGRTQLVLTLGDYANAPAVSIMPMGDSITHGVGAGENYRIPLMERLAAAGYRVTTRGVFNNANNSHSWNAAQIEAPAAYRWHSGWTGMMCRTDKAAGWEDAVEATMAAAGEPDFVTFMIGSNDLNNNGNGGVGNKDDNLASFFESWTNVVWRILKASPNTRVICGTVTPAGGNTETIAIFNARIDAFNEMLKNQIANGDFPAGRVLVADIHDAVPQDATPTNYRGDYVHPNWTGHAKVADAWFDAIQEALGQSFTKQVIEYTTTSTAAENVPTDYTDGFVHIATFTPTETGKFTANSEIGYTYTNEQVKSATFSKVGYYMALRRRNTDLVDYHGQVRYVWVDMDAFGNQNLTSLGLPLYEKNQQVVTSLHVYSNDTGIRQVLPTDNSAKGFIEFWPYTYGGAVSDIEGAPAAITNFTGAIDWNDTPTTSFGYGSMQVHRIFEPGESWNAGEVLFAFNNWTANNQSKNEIGIGSFCQKADHNTIDYTYMTNLDSMNAAAYDLMSIEIWGVVESMPTTWTGNGDGETWTQAANWDNGVPGEKSFVTLPSGSTIELTEDVTVGTLQVEDASVTIGGTGAIIVKSPASSSFKGAMTVVFENALPTSALQTQFQSADWKGEVVLKNITATGAFHPEYFGNENSIVTFCGIYPGGFPESGSFAGTIKLVDNGDEPAWKMGDGYSRDTTGYIIAKLVGDGRYEDLSASVTQQYTINDASGFTGDLTILGKRWVFGTTAETGSNGRITIQEGQTIKLVGQTWLANGGVSVKGTIGGKGTLTNTTFGATATLDATNAELLTVNGTVTCGNALTILLNEAPTANKPIKVLNGSFEPAPYTVGLTLMVGEEAIDGEFTLKATAEGIFVIERVHKIWTGLGGDLEWSNPANWEPTGVPEPSDKLDITAADTKITVVADEIQATEINVAEGADLVFNVTGANTGVCATVISGAGTIGKTGDGALMLSGVSPFEGLVDVKAGTLVVGVGTTGNASPHDGPLGKYYIDEANWTTNVIVRTGATLDLNGKADQTYGFVLEEGATLKNAAANIGTGNRQTKYLVLDGDATVDATAAFGLHNGGNAKTVLDLGDNTLTKIGTNSFDLVNTEIRGAGTIVIAEGTLKTYNSGSVNLGSVASNATLRLEAGTALNLGAALTVKDFEVVLPAGAVTPYALPANLTVTNALRLDAADAELIATLAQDGVQLVTLTAAQAGLKVETAGALNVAMTRKNLKLVATTNGDGSVTYATVKRPGFQLILR